MSLLFETILIENGAAVSLDYHQRRMNAARYHFWQSAPVNLAEHIPQSLPKEKSKCRIEYSEGINDVIVRLFKTRVVKSLQIVHSDEIKYSYKFCNREELELLFSQRKSADDILIIKNGLVADTTIANMVFTDGVKMYSPASPLLNGTQRTLLIERGIIEEADISEKDIKRFSAWQHINALNPLTEERFLPINSIHW